MGSWPGPLGGRAHCRLGTHSKTHCAGFVEQGTASRVWLRGDSMSEVSTGISLSPAILPRKPVHRCFEG